MLTALYHSLMHKSTSNCSQLVTIICLCLCLRSLHIDGFNNGNVVPRSIGEDDDDES